MSHVTSIEVVIQDLAELRKACATIGGLTLVEGQKSFSWYGRFLGDWNTDQAAVQRGYNSADFGKCEHAIKVDGCKYEIGLVKNKDGPGYKILYDVFGEGRKIAEKLGANGEKLIQRYAANVATQKLRQKGMRVTERLMINGTIKLSAN